MIELNFGTFEARVWVNELPSTELAAFDKIERTVIASRPITDGQIRRGAVEIYRHLSASSYALLGAEFVPAASQETVIIAHVSESNGPLFSGALPGKLDEARIGLPVEYAPSVLEGAEQAPNLLGPGTLTFNRAAHGLVGSSPWLFRKLAGAVIDLLARAEADLTKAEFESLLRIRHH